MRTQSRCGPPPKPRRKVGCAPAGSRSGCGSLSDGLDSFDKIVGHYRRYYSDEVVADRTFYARAPTPAEAVRRACLSLRNDDRLHPHQHRLGYQRMAEAARLMSPFVGALMAAEDFAELHRIVETHLSSMGGFGELAIYDITQRIGWYRGIEPAEVYLHSGTREGARALVPAAKGRTMPSALLPPELQALSPAQLEDVLCIYKSEIRGIVDRRNAWR